MSFLIIAGCGGDIRPGNTEVKPGSTIKAEVATVETTRQPILYEAVGTVQARTAATISAKVMGQVKTVGFNVGDRVRKGDKLATIEGREIRAKLEQARAGLLEAKQGRIAAESALNAAQSGKNLAEATYRRYKALLASDSVSRQEFEEIESRYRQAKAAEAQAKSMMASAEERVNQAQSATEGAESAWSDTIISAPYNGIVSARLVDPGDMASPGTPLLKVEESGAFDVRLIVPETHIHSIAIGDTVAVRIDTLQKDAMEGKIRTIDPSADPSSLSFQVKVAIPEAAGLRSGLFSRVSIPVGHSGMILVPDSAFIHHGELTGMFLVEKDGTARFRLIRTGRTFGDQVEVLSGLHGGETYVIRPSHAIEDGVKVEAAQ